MTSQRKAPRGARPEDEHLFSPAEVGKLRLACEEAAYLLGRGYVVSSVVDVVGRRHQLEARQRLALQRSMCSEQQRNDRAARRVGVDCVRNRVLEVDGFNLIIGLEVALSGGLVLRGTDGALRDLAGLRGSYCPIDETERALSLLARVSAEIAPAAAHFVLDAKVPHSGALRARIFEHGAYFGCEVAVDLVANADRELSGRELVVSSDSMVIDSAKSWVNLLAHVLERHVPQARIVDLDVFSDTRRA